MRAGTARKLTPPLVVTVPFLALWIKALAFEWWLHTEHSILAGEIGAVRGVVCNAAAGIYAVWRVGYFHPAVRKEYRDWLRMTPWRAPQPLPCGPAQLFWFDVAVVILLTLMASSLGAFPDLRPAAIFGGVFAVTTSFVLVVTGSEIIPFLIVLCGAAVIAFKNTGWLATILFLAALVLANVGIRRSLANFREWGATASVLNLNRAKTSRRRVGTCMEPPRELGWPYSVMRAPEKSFASLPRHVFAIAFLLSAFTAAIWLQSSEYERREFVAAGTLIAFGSMLLAPLAALLVATKLGPPTSLLGSICRFQFFRRGHDEIPLVAAATMTVVPLVLFTRGGWLPGPLPIMATFWIDALAIVAIAKLYLRLRLVGSGRFRAVRPAVESVEA
ncbi:MAG: hypothetical protein AB7N71_07680 [Phycisphaerae bacterium]